MRPVCQRESIPATSVVFLENERGRCLRYPAFRGEFVIDLCVHGNFLAVQALAASWMCDVPSPVQTRRPFLGLWEAQAKGRTDYVWSACSWRSSWHTCSSRCSPDLRPSLAHKSFAFPAYFSEILLPTAARQSCRMISLGFETGVLLVSPFRLESSVFRPLARPYWF
ncbi:hypothetical protein BDW02DRAFT_295478 [Decorospora gaudefroyi]|uniref:Uncharacterized protein n=1 Tax=Decorospora gaudefroyi TaxID=184978 RepID=A0A6A5KHI7_9PLEO|nr:hypothetical protein BDW02DRAFT_295478 [Decorospora gaudefroyi]